MIKDYCLILLKKAIYKQENNGQKVLSNYENIKHDFYVTFEELSDEISASIYGAEINKMIRITSLRYELETYLLPKVDNIEDNISNYFIFLNNHKYKIIAINSYRIDLKRV